MARNSDYYASIAHLIPALRRYADDHIPTGGFLRACLENDLKEAAGRADLQNRYLLFEIAVYLYNEIPAACWGSPEKVAAWIARQPAEMHQPVAESVEDEPYGHTS